MVAWLEAVPVFSGKEDIIYSNFLELRILVDVIKLSHLEACQSAHQIPHSG